MIIADDSTESDQQLTLDLPCEVIHIRVPRMTIGSKRNFLLKRALQTTCEWFVFFDSDDVYFDSYVSTSIFEMCRQGKDVSGSSDMLLINKGVVHSQCCLWMNYCNEATLACHRSYAETHRFKDASSSEGLEFVDIACLAEIPIERIMLCVVHDSNTIPKEVWLRNPVKIDLAGVQEQLTILDGIK